jgi:hypothetical protein
VVGLRDLTEPGQERSAILRLRSLATQLGVAPSLKQLARALESVATAPLRFLAQNTALLPSTLYKGADQDEAIAALVTMLRASAPDVVGLSECWTGKTKEQITKPLKDLYPYSLSGPGTGLVNADVEDGGLLLLSRHRIVAHHETIFRQCEGEDCESSKGALHAQIAVAGHPALYDVFLAHTQSPNPKLGEDADAREALLSQAQHLGAFIAACRGDGPALLLGDLNIAADGGDYAQLAAALGGARDLWSSCGRATLAAIGVTDPDRQRGITFDEVNPFETGGSLPLDSASRNHQGDRIDYAFCWPGEDFLSLFGGMEIVRAQTANGRELSDHYGLALRQAKVARRALPLDSRPIKNLQIRLERFRCLEVTDGTIPGVDDDDEVQFTLTGRPQSGSPQNQLSALIEDISNGTAGTFDPAPTLSFGDPGDYLDVEVWAQEMDSGSPVAIGVGPVNVGGAGGSAANLVGAKLRWSRRHLQALDSATRTLPLLTGDGGQYVVTVSLVVEKA